MFYREHGPLLGAINCPMPFGRLFVSDRYIVVFHLFILSFPQLIFHCYNKYYYHLSLLYPFSLSSVSFGLLIFHYIHP